MRFAFFLGCNVPTQVYNYEASVRKIADAFGITLVDIPDFGCCGELTEAMDHYTALLYSARNIALAEREELDMLTLCNGCFSSLNKAIFALKDPHVRSNVNRILERMDLSYKGNSRVFHFHQVMHDIVGPSRIKERIIFSLNSVSVSCHNGCHILRPSDILGFDDPENPKKLEELVELTGAKIIKPTGAEQCCGSVLSLHDLDTSQSFAIESIERKGKVDAIVVGCPFCFKQFDMGQVVARKKFNKQLNIPILFYAELLGLALGISVTNLGLNVIHKIGTQDFLKKAGVDNG